MREAKKEIKDLFGKLLSLWFSVNNAPKWCCYYDLPYGGSIWFFSDDSWLIHYDWDIWLSVTLEEVIKLLK